MLATALTSALILAGCTPATPATPATPTPAASTPAPTQTVTATVSAIPTPTASALAAKCRYGDLSSYVYFEAFTSWSLVQATYGSDMHPGTIKDMSKAIKSFAKYEVKKPCTGHDELVAFGASVAGLKSVVDTSEDYKADYIDYQAVVETGNEWLAVVGYTKKQLKIG